MSEVEHTDLSRLRISRAETPKTDDLPRKKIWIAIYILCGLFLLAGLFFFLKTLGPEEQVEVGTVTLISPSQATALLTANGYVVAQRKAAIASKATGRLVYLGFREGDRVKKDQIIARLESADVEASLAQAQADLAVAKADLKDANQSLERARKLLSGNLISQAEFDAAQARYDRVVASIASKEAAAKVAAVQFENTRIRAPFDGTVLSKNADIGEVVAPFGAGASSRVAVVTIADMSSLEVEADVSESNIEKISIGQPCDIVLDAYPGQRYKGIVDKIVPTADRAKATVLTKIRFTERDSRVLPEMGAKVNFLPGTSGLVQDRTPTIAVPTSALVRESASTFVFLYRNNSVVQQNVETGSTLGPYTEIKHGLSPGDQVVLKPSQTLTSGARVTLKGK